MRIGAGLFLIAVGAILRFGISTVSMHGIAVHTIGDILMLVGVLGVALWLVVWAPWSRSRRPAYRDPAYRDPAYRDQAPPDAVPPARRHPAADPYDPYQEEYRR